jgi:hypothetical protein
MNPRSVIISRYVEGIVVVVVVAVVLVVDVGVEVVVDVVPLLGLEKKPVKYRPTPNPTTSIIMTGRTAVAFRFILTASPS